MQTSLHQSNQSPVNPEPYTKVTIDIDETKQKELKEILKVTIPTEMDTAYLGVTGAGKGLILLTGPKDQAEILLLNAKTSPSNLKPGECRPYSPETLIACHINERALILATNYLLKDQPQVPQNSLDLIGGALEIVGHYLKPVLR